MGTLLANCPFCNYSLEGLPVEHTCPECGQAFDRRWRVFGHQPYWRYLGARWRIGLLIWLFGCPIVACLSLLIRLRFFEAIAILVISGLGSTVLGLWGLFSWPRFFVIVSKDAVIPAQRQDGKRGHYPLSGITEAGVDLWNRLVLRSEGQASVRIPFRASRAEAERCAAYINALIDRDG